MQSLDVSAAMLRSPLLAALPEPARQAARLLALAKSARLFAQGDAPNAMYVVLSGEIHLVRPSAQGAKVILQRTRLGFLAEASLDHAAYHCDAVAAAPSTLLAVPRAAFRAAVEDTAFRARWIAHLSRELRRARMQVERMGLKSAEARILHYVETEGADGRVRLGQAKKDWAAELGLTHEALYRALARMARSGRISVSGPVIAVTAKAGGPGTPGDGCARRAAAGRTIS